MAVAVHEVEMRSQGHGRVLGVHPVIHNCVLIQMCTSEQPPSTARVDGDCWKRSRSGGRRGVEHVDDVEREREML